MERIVLRANDGYILTNGKDYGRIIYLAIGSNAADYYEITIEKYNEIIEEQSQLNINEGE